MHPPEEEQPTARANAPPPNVHEAPASARHGPYVALTRLGAGGMGEVWKAWDTELRRWVALKLLHPGGEIERFKREARLAGRLAHPHIAAVYQVGESDTRHFIAMQFVDGRTLRAARPAEPREVVRLIRDAARAAAFAHRGGVVHRDIKPENLMVTAAGHLYVLDFGLARPTEDAAKLSTSGLVVGTPAYMSPEQAWGLTVDARGDVYSLGATLYDLLAGRPPFTGPNAYAIVECVRHADPPSLRSVRRGADAELDTIVQKCLEKDPRRRYAGADALADDLDRWLGGEEIHARPPSTWYKLRKRLLKRRAIVATVAGVLLVLGVAAAIVGPRWIAAAREARRQELLRAEESDRLRRLGALWTEVVDRRRELRRLEVPAARGRAAFEKAVEAVREMVRDDPRDPRVRYTLA
jgi:serine/threonine-protein kinase